MPRAVVLGGAGFLGSHLCDRLVQRGDDVVAVDDLSSGSLRNLRHLDGSPNFRFIQADISMGIPVTGHVDAVLNFASLASPPRYGLQKVHTLRTGSAGTENALTLARISGARFLMASTSEIYGDPFVHPQREDYWGHVNPIGPRSCYDEAKRFSEALSMAYLKEFGVDVSIVRIFNTYGPRLDPNDGRVISNFLAQAIRGDALTVYGSGEQTRSFCYVDDEVDGILALLDSGNVGPINIGNPTEVTMLELAQTVNEVVGTHLPISFEPLPQDDPSRRCPDISLARQLLNWEPKIDLSEGLSRTAEWFKKVVA